MHESTDLIQIQLESGREIYAEQCLISQTCLSASDVDDFDRVFQWPIEAQRLFPGPFTVLRPTMTTKEWGYDPPPFRLMAQFMSDPIAAGDTTFDLSYLTVIWFQDTPTPWISPQNQSAFEGLNWEELATNGNW